jgi:hypothetical protein
MLIDFIWVWFKGSDLRFIKTHESRRSGRLETQTNAVDEDGPEWARCWLPFCVRASAAWCTLFAGVCASCQCYRVHGSPPHLFLYLHFILQRKQRMEKKNSTGLNTEELKLLFNQGAWRECGTSKFFCYHYWACKVWVSKKLFAIFLFSQFFSRETLLFFKLFYSPILSLQQISSKARI